MRPRRPRSRITKGDLDSVGNGDGAIAKPGSTDEFPERVFHWRRQFRRIVGGTRGGSISSACIHLCTMLLGWRVLPWATAVTLALISNASETMAEGSKRPYTHISGRSTTEPTAVSATVQVRSPATVKNRLPTRSGERDCRQTLTIAVVRRRHPAYQGEDDSTRRVIRCETFIESLRLLADHVEATGG
jgi:ribosomal protein L31